MPNVRQSRHLMVITCGLMPCEWIGVGNRQLVRLRPTALRFRSQKERTARLAPAVQVWEESPWGRGATWECHSLYLAFRKAACIDDAQFSISEFAAARVSFMNRVEAH
jgi:hypothetical protein